MGQGFQGTTALLTSDGGGADQTLIQVLAATNHGIKIDYWGVSFKGTDLDAGPIEVILARQSDAGTMGAHTLRKRDDSNGDTLDTSSLEDATVEPTTGDVLRRKFVHPTGGYTELLPLGKEIHVGAGDRIAVIINDNSVAIVCAAELGGEE